MTVRHGTISDFVLKLSDLSLVLVTLGVMIVVRYAPGEDPTFVVDYLSERVKVANAILGFLLLLSWYAAFTSQRLYTSHRLSSFADELTRISRAVMISSAALLVAAQLGNWPTINALTVAGFCGVSFVVIALMRLGLRINLRRLRAAVITLSR